jgi:hypothetical protein
VGRRKAAAGATAVVLALAFIVGVYALFRLRVDAADAYPPYSTMRADPLGAKALYESLALQSGLTVTRNMRPLSNLGGHDTTLFLLGVDEWFADSTLNHQMTPDIDRMARSGGRLVIAFVPRRPRLESEVEMERQLVGDKIGNKKGVETKHVPTLFEKLGVSPVTEIEKRRTDWSPDPPRYTALWFDKLAPEWAVQKTYRNHPVWIERPWLNGSVVLVADSWMLSNEAFARMSRMPPQLHNWWVESSRRFRRTTPGPHRRRQRRRSDAAISSTRPDCRVVGAGRLVHLEKLIVISAARDASLL